MLGEQQGIDDTIEACTRRSRRRFRLGDQMPRPRAGQEEFTLQSSPATWTYFMVISALTCPRSVIRAGKLTPARTISVAYVWRLFRGRNSRHTAATKMAEAGVPESTMLAIMGHMSRAMLERYSHIRMAAKREAVKSLAIPKVEVDSEVVPKGSPKVEGVKFVQ
jgi:integrase